MPFKDGSYDDAGFWEQVNSETPTLLGFWSYTCAPCKVMAPVFERLGKRFKGRMEFVAVSVYDREDIARQFEVSSTPTFIVTVGGQAVRRIQGVVPEKAFAEAIEPLALPAPVGETSQKRRGLFGLFRKG